MRLINLVFNALRTADRPCSRTEIETATQLDRDSVRAGLRGLARRGDLVCGTNNGRIATYGLRPGAQDPDDQRGDYPRDPVHRKRMAVIMRHRRATGPVCWIGPAAPPSHHVEPGALRVVKQQLRASSSDVPRFSLAELLKR